MTLRDQILQYRSTHPGATATEMEKAFKVVHQQVNSACHALEREGRLVRQKPSTGGKISNYLTGDTDVPLIAPFQEYRNALGEPLDEESIKRLLTDKLTSED